MKALLLAALLLFALLLAFPLGSSVAPPPSSVEAAARPLEARLELTSPGSSIAENNRNPVAAREASYIPWDPIGWRGRLGTYPKDTLAGRVLRGSRPLAGARVRIWLRNDNTQGRGSVPALREAVSGVSGKFSFDGLEFETYLLRADHGLQTVVSHRNTLLPSQKSSRGVVLLFGAATLEGEVLGDPASRAGREVWVTGIGPDRTSRTRTDALGFFRVQGLAQGDHYVHVEAGPQGRTPLDSCRARVESGVTTRVVLGIAAPTARSSWRIVDRTGQPVEGKFRVGLTPEGQAGEYWTTIYGKTSKGFPPGQYGVVWDNGVGQVQFRTQVDVSGAAAQQDLVLPGARLIVEVLDPLGVPAEDTSLTLGLEGTPERSKPARLKKGQYQWAPLSPGKYLARSRCWRFAGDAQEGGIIVQVDDAATQHVTLTAIGSTGSLSESGD